MTHVCLLLLFQLDLESIWQFIFNVPAGQTKKSNINLANLCPDAIFVILSQIRAMLNQVMC